MYRYEIINHLIKKNDYTSYLEIGIMNGDCFNKVECISKVAVDPDVRSRCNSNLIHVTSDEFFKNNDRSFDIIFIDGLHMEEQVSKDLYNSFNFLSDNGTIVIHDCNPYNEKMQKVDDNYDTWTSDMWTGDVWKAWVKFRKNGFKQFVINTDFGVGILTKERTKAYNYAGELSYSALESNRKEWLNLISIEDFLQNKY